MRNFIKFEERKIIEDLKRQGVSNLSIAKTLNRSHSFVNAELRRFNVHLPNETYNAEKAQHIANEVAKRKRYSKPAQQKLKENASRILQLIEEGHSLNYIALKIQVSRPMLRCYLENKNISPVTHLQPKSLEQRITSLEMQMEILTHLIKEIHK